jgi:aldehyde:ferredoxin oxidoreductase
MSKAYMGKILRVKLSEGTVVEEDLRDDWARRFIGGAGICMTRWQVGSIHLVRRTSLFS